MKNKIIAYFTILRPINIIIAAVSVLATSYLLDNNNYTLISKIALIVISFTAASNILNDLIDLNIDLINKPHRPLPSKNLNKYNAIIIMIILYIAGIYFSLNIHYLGSIIALSIVLPLSVIYTSVLKKIPLLGNFTIAIIVGSVFIFTEAATFGYVNKMLIPFFLATNLTIIRELVKDAADIKGDSINNINTFPTKYGFISTLKVLRFLTLVLCLFGIITILSNIYNMIYSILIIIFILLPLIWIFFIKLNYTSKIIDYQYSAKFLKIITFAGVLVILSTGL